MSKKAEELRAQTAGKIIELLASSGFNINPLADEILRNLIKIELEAHDTVSQAISEKKGKWNYKSAQALRKLDWEVERVTRAARIVEWQSYEHHELDEADLQAFFDVVWEWQENEESDPLDEEAEEWAEERVEAKKAKEDK